MNLFVERLMFPFVTICFLLFSIWVGSLQAQESTSASFFNGGGEINLIWNHTLSSTGTLIFSAVNTDAEVFEEGAAIADAAAESLLDTSDTGGVRTTVALDGIVSGSKALSNSRAIAQNFFLLQNTSDKRVTVNFNWSAEWLVSAAIDQPETNRSEMALRLTLAKHKLESGGRNAIKRMVKILKRTMKRSDKQRIRSKRRQLEIFSKYVAVRLPTEGFVNYDSGHVTDGFEVTFRPKEIYLFGLSTEAGGLASVSVEGCSATFWKRHKKSWPIHPRTKFSEVFGIGPEDMSLWAALRKPQRHVNEPRFFRNAVAAMLNAGSSGIPYYIDDPDVLVTLVKDTYESGNADELKEITDDLEFHNNVGASYTCKSSLL